MSGFAHPRQPRDKNRTILSAAPKSAGSRASANTGLEKDARGISFAVQYRFM